MSGDWLHSHTIIRVSYSPKEILCWRIFAPTTSFSTTPGLIFTHGASSKSLYSKGMSDFINGFTAHSGLLAFEGNSNLKSRAKMFSAVIEYHEDKILNLGGRSMGARAAVLSATENTKCLVLVSYPLNGGDERKQILLDLREDVRVLFVIGTKDELCDLDALNEVRKEMKAKTWLIRVVGAGHGMDVKRGKDKGKVGQMTGAVAELFVRDDEVEESKLEGFIQWNPGEDDKSGEAIWSGWRTEDESEDTTVISEKNPGGNTEKIPVKQTPAKKTPTKKTPTRNASVKRTSTEEAPTRRSSKGKTPSKAPANEEGLESSIGSSPNTDKVDKRKAEDDSGSISTRTRRRRKTG